MSAAGFPGGVLSIWQQICERNKCPINVLKQDQQSVGSGGPPSKAKDTIKRRVSLQTSTDDFVHTALKGYRDSFVSNQDVFQMCTRKSTSGKLRIIPGSFFKSYLFHSKSYLFHSISFHRCSRRLHARRSASKGYFESYAQ